MPDHAVEGSVGPDLYSPGLPLFFVVDFDGTIADAQLTDELLIRYARTDAWREMDELYLKGLAGSRGQLAAFVDMLDVDERTALATVVVEPADSSFRNFVTLARSLGAGVEVVSDGYGFYVAPALAAMGVTDVPIVTAETSWASGRPRITFPAGHPMCFVCGTCKRSRVLHHQTRGKHTVLVGDGASDRYGAAHADTTFAKSLLARICREEGWPYRPWESFSEISEWLVDVARDPWSIPPPRLDRPFICGPEAWGPGRWDPVVAPGA